MKIERINDNQIRCTLTSFDLSVRNLNLGELAYGSEKACSLFREMIQKASNEVGFEAEDIPLMVEAIPLSSESIMLIITKIDDPEELDTRFSKFTPVSDDASDTWSELATQLLEGADDILSYFTGNMELPEKMRKDTPVPKDNEEDALLSRAYRFGTLDHVSEAASVIGRRSNLQNTLYKNPATAAYYLTISSTGLDSMEFNRICNLLAEYGTKVKHEAGNEAHYQEHYQVIIAENALQKLAGI